MANVERRIEGFGHFSYDQAVYDELMRLNKAELVEMELDDTVYQRTAVRGLKKADLAVLVAHRETARREWNANCVMSELTNRDDQPSGDDHLSAQDLLEFYGDTGAGQDFALGDVPELEYTPEPIAAPDGLGQRDPNEGIDEWHAFMSEQAEVEATNEADADAELISFMRTVVDAPSLPEFPITETDVSAAEVSLVVQFGKELLWGKLVSVINRRTRFLPAFLVVVEFPDGIRRMVRADHTLAA